MFFRKILQLQKRNFLAFGLFFALCACFAPISGNSQDVVANELKTNYLIYFSINSYWPANFKTDSFYIVSIADSKLVINTIEKKLDGLPVQGLPVAYKVLTPSSIHSIPFAHIIYIDKKYHEASPSIIKSFSNKPTLFIGESGAFQGDYAIYFGTSDALNKTIPFVVNQSILNKNNIILNKGVEALANIKLDAIELIVKSEIETLREQLKNHQLLKTLELKRNTIADQNLSLYNYQDVMSVRQKTIEQQNQEIERQRKVLLQLFESADSSKRVNKIKSSELATKELQLAELKQEIQDQQYKIKAQEEDIDRRNRLLAKLDNDITAQSNRIVQQRSSLQEFEKRVEYQKLWLYFFALAVLLSIISIFLILKAYRTKRIASIILEEKNRSIETKSQLIEQQKEEILAQAEMLERTNKELEKLSIVASETENSVIIMDNRGNFDWVNPGFTRMTGFSLEELKHKKGNNLLSTSTNPKIEEILDFCINNKRAVIYDSFFEKFNSEVVWLQTTLTPIVKADGRVERLVAIDTNITKLKDIERELQQSNEELIVQRDELTIQKGRIERQNRHITESIVYAKTIQNAILPMQEDIDAFFKTFIIYKPKDIVSGDFYWFTPLQSNSEYSKRILLAVADCTGHGVPGAMMSMIGNSLLNETVHERGITSPDAILKELDISFRKALKQDKRNSLDGMEMCLCLIEGNENEIAISFSGAKRSLYHYHADTNAIFRIKATPRELGGFIYKEEKLFELTRIVLGKGDCIYLCTDGFADQAGKNNIRFGKQRLLKVLRDNGHQPLLVQKNTLEKSLSEWQQDIRQRDDITIVCLKFE